MSVSAAPHRTLPIGDLTFLFTDIEGSTRLWERAGGAMRRALVRHDELLRKSIERNGGVVFKTVGDSFFCVFERPERALAAAVDAQRALAGEPWPSAIGELLVRIALHSGPAVLRRSDYFGPTLNRIARLTAAAHGGQILVSSATAALVAKKLGGVQLRDLGTHRLKDLGEPDVIFQVIAPGLRSEFLAPASLDAAPHNLPAQISSFVGRTADLERLRQLTHRHPLVTIAGLGGIGKTRLAVQLAAEAIAEYKDGCWFVALKEIDDPSQIVQATADALRLRGVPGEPIEERLLEHLFKKTALIVIDNAEHVIEGVATFARRLLQVAADVRVIVTSREPLHIAGEQVLRLGPLDDGERLFIDRAKALRSDAMVSDEASRAVAGICAKLEGIPLAIEIAAARVATLSVEQLDELLGFRLPLSDSRGDESDGPLESMLEWSYRLLGRREKRFLAHLAMFEGPFSLEAAQAIASDEGRREDAIELLGSLVDKSLISHAVEGGTSRYWLLNVVREFAAERLRVSGDSTTVSERYCAYYLALVRSLAASKTNSETTIALMAEQWANVRNALRLAIDERIDVDGARWAVRSLWEFWLATGRTTEGWHWINRALEGTDLPSHLRIELLKRAAQIASSRQDFAALDPLAKLLVEAYERSGDAAGLGSALQLLANAKAGLGNGDEAEMYQRRSLAQYQAAGDRRGIAAALANLGTMAEQYHLNYEIARQLQLHSLELFRELDSPQNCANILGNLSVTSMRAGQFVHALGYARESLAIYRRLGNDTGAALQYITMAEIYVEMHRAGEAIPELRAARVALGERPNRLYLAYYFEAAFKAAVELKAYRQAALIYGYVDHHRNVARTPRQPSQRPTIESRLSTIAKNLSPPLVARLEREGASLPSATAEGLIERLESSPLQPSTMSLGSDLR